MERVNFRVYNAHSVTREARRSGHCCVNYFSHPLSFSLPLSLSALSAVLDGKTMTVKVREGNRHWKVERLLCAKQLLMRRNCNIKTGRSCEVGDWLMAPISQRVSQLWAAPTLWYVMTELYPWQHLSNALPIQSIPSSFLLLTSHLRSKNWGKRLKSSF